MKALDMEEPKKLVIMIFDTIKFLSILPLLLAKNSYKHKCNDYQNNFNKNFY